MHKKVFLRQTVCVFSFSFWFMTFQLYSNIGQNTNIGGVRNMATSFITVQNERYRGRGGRV